MLIELINATLTQRPLNEKVFESVTEKDWQQCYNMALAQGVLAMTFPAMSSLPKMLRPSFTLWSKWMAYTDDVAKQSLYKREVVKKIGAWLNEDGLSTTLLKGFSLSELYPNPDLREFSDIDIFSGENYEAVNKCFAKHGVKVDNVDGHHAYLNVDGISVEHHFAFSNTKVKKGLIGPEEELQSLAVQDRKQTNILGICYPNPLFTALFVGWHAYEHFLQEKIQLRHLIDWALALKQLTEEDAETLSLIKEHTKWGKFTDTLTATVVRHLNLPQVWFSNIEIESAANIPQEQERRVWNDILFANHTPNSKILSLRRGMIAKRMLNNSWKFDEYAEMNAKQLLWKEFVGHLKHKNKKRYV